MVLARKKNITIASLPKNNQWRGNGQLLAKNRRILGRKCNKWLNTAELKWGDYSIYKTCQSVVLTSLQNGQGHPRFPPETTENEL